MNKFRINPSGRKVFLKTCKFCGDEFPTVPTKPADTCLACKKLLRRASAKGLSVDEAEKRVQITIENRNKFRDEAGKHGMVLTDGIYYNAFHRKHLKKVCLSCHCEFFTRYEYPQELCQVCRKKAVNRGPEKIARQYNAENQRSLEYSKADEAFLDETMRKCHDCKKPTYNYRCPECLKKFREKHGVSEFSQDVKGTGIYDVYTIIR